MKNRCSLTISVALLIGASAVGFVLAGEAAAQQAGATTHTIFMTAVEVKGSTTTDKLAAPAVNPQDLSKGYEFKAPGEADKKDPKKWEVTSYLFAPGFVTVRQGDTVKLTAFVVNGTEHVVKLNDPDGREVVPQKTWNRGRQYEMSFVAEKPGPYQMMCSNHAPSMLATFLVLPR